MEQSDASMKDRYIGCMVGALIGDVLGDPFEREDLAKPVPLPLIFKWFDGLEKKSGKHHYTDDTEMTKALAESLIAKNGYDAQDCCKRYVDEYYLDKDYDPRYGCHASLLFSIWKKAPPNFDILEPARQQFNGQGSCGNGSAMRVSPVALFCYGNVDQTIKMAKETSLLTHTHQDGVNGAILACLAVYHVLELSKDSEVNAQEFVDWLIKQMTEVEGLTYKNPKDFPYCKKLKDMKTLLKQPSVLEQHVIDTLGNGILAVDAVPIAIFAFLQGIIKELPGIETKNKFEKIIQYSISLGGDTDTIGSMAGAIAGAYLGHCVIPERLQNACRGIQNAVERGTKLYDIVTKRSA